MNTQMHLCRRSLARHCHCHKYTHPPSLTPTCSSQHNLLKGLLLCVVVMMLHCALQQYIYTRVCPDLACIHYTAIQLSQAKLLKRPLYTGAVRNPQHMACIGNPVTSLKTKMERIEPISLGAFNLYSSLPWSATPAFHHNWGTLTSITAIHQITVLAINRSEEEFRIKCTCTEKREAMYCSMYWKMP